MRVGPQAVNARPLFPGIPHQGIEHLGPDDADHLAIPPTTIGVIEPLDALLDNIRRVRVKELRVRGLVVHFSA